MKKKVDLSGQTVDEMIAEARSTPEGAERLDIIRAALVVENPREAYEFAKAAEERHSDTCSARSVQTCPECRRFNAKTEAAREVLEDSEEAS